MGLRRFIRNTKLYKQYREKKEKAMNDEEYFLMRHKKIFGYTPDFTNPQTFNEKIIHRILFDRKPLYTALADKLKARIYIATLLRDFPQCTTQKAPYHTNNTESIASTKQNNLNASSNPHTNNRDSMPHHTDPHAHNNGGGGAMCL